MFRTRVSPSLIPRPTRLNSPLKTCPHPSSQYPFVRSVLSQFKAVLARTLAPLGDRILVRKAAKEVQTAGGILLPTDNAKSPNEGSVIAVGPGIRDVSGVLHAPTLLAGDTVLLPEYGGSKITIENEEMFLYREDDILGKFA